MAGGKGIFSRKSKLEKLKAGDKFLESLGVSECKAELIWFSDALYRGETGCFDGKKMRHGLGIMVYSENQRRYEGLWLKDRRHGKGMEVYSNGDVYMGDFYRGRP